MPIDPGNGWVDLGRLYPRDTRWHITTGDDDYYVWPTTSTSTTYSQTYTWNWTTSSTSTNYLHWPRGSTGTAMMYGEREVEVLPVEQAVAEVQRSADELRRSRVVANGRALQLLSELLDEAQQASYRLDGFFEIMGSEGTLYRVRRGTSGNVEWIKPDGTVGGKLCAHPTMREQWLPTEDVVIAQMLALTTDERAWLAVANLHAGQRPPLHDALMI